MMELKLEVYTALCIVRVFTINGIDADYEDFGTKGDRAPIVSDDPWDSYCCGNMRFEEKRSTPEVLKKYNITQEEYHKVCDELGSKLSFGSCGWCL